MMENQFRRNICTFLNRQTSEEDRPSTQCIGPRGEKSNKNDQIKVVKIIYDFTCMALHA